MSQLELADQLAASALAVSFATANDSSDFEEFRRVLADEAIFSVTIAGEPAVGPLDGAKVILEFLESALGGQTDQRRHVISNIRVSGADDGAVVDAYLTIFSIADGQLSAISTGQYRFDVRLEGDRPSLRKVHIALDLPY